MIMRIIGFNLDIEFTEDAPAVLAINNAKLFADIVMKLFKCINGVSLSNEFVIIDETDNMINFSKDIMLYTDIVNNSINDRKILNKIYHNIETDIYNDSNTIMSLQEKFSNINTMLLQYLIDMDIDLIYNDEIKLSDYFKVIELRIDDSEIDTIYDKLCYTIDIESQLHLYKCILFINALLYLDNDKINELVRYIKYKKVKVLFIERYDINISCINSFVIDDDFIEYKS